MGHKSNLSKFKKIEIVAVTFFSHSAMRLDINYKKKSVRNTNTWRLNNTFLNDQQVTEEIKREIKKFLDVPGILQARTLEWVAISFSNA